jgi:MtN3 and saliva related transmembrane protein
MRGVDWIGWTASAILLATLVRQIQVQWRERSTEGLSRWMFVGQLAASVGFLLYSWLVHNWVFVATNSAILITAGIGQWVYHRNKRLEQSGQASETGGTQEG